MMVADFNGLPLAADAASARPHEVTLVRDTLSARFTRERPARLIGDRAYDSDPLDRELEAEGVELIAPHRANRSKAATQDGRALRRYRRLEGIEALHMLRKGQVKRLDGRDAVGQAKFVESLFGIAA